MRLLSKLECRSETLEQFCERQPRRRKKIIIILSHLRLMQCFPRANLRIEVATALNLREPEVTIFYTEFCNLNNFRALGQVYNEIKGDIAYFLELYRLTKAAGMNTQNIKRILEIAHRDLSSIEYRYRALQREISSLEAENRNSARIFQELNDRIIDLQKTRDSLHSACRELGLEITKLRIQKIRLEADCK